MEATTIEGLLRAVGLCPLHEGSHHPRQAGTIDPVPRWENGGPEQKPKVTQPGINDGARIAT